MMQMLGFLRLAVVSSVYRASDRRAEQEATTAPRQADHPTDIANADDDVPFPGFPVFPAVAPQAEGLEARPTYPRRPLTDVILVGLTALSSGTLESFKHFR